eukprot:TRINITY_DN1395_c0_g1_i4.p1 TRINITY_DN1395_c0_g1~~TRINITY_DN1395_c0_g1_i4.p1  ORF type:complete len:172 (+),score=9.83 TRINITY_DN1395_c0_g1_i4:43-558(+)
MDGGGLFMLNPLTGEELIGAPRLQVHSARYVHPLTGEELRLQVHSARYVPPHERKMRMPQRTAGHRHRHSRGSCPHSRSYRISSSLIDQYTCRFTLTNASKLPEENRSCTICLDSFEDGRQLRTLPCLHFFHPGCVDRWLKDNARCPTCRACLSDLSQKAAELTSGPYTLL